MSDRLDEIRQRWAAATRAPWRYEGIAFALNAGDNDEGPSPYSSCVVESDITGTEVGEVHRRKDATAIAAAPEDVAWLVGEVERLRQPTAEDIAAWLHAHPDQVAAVLARAYVADAWHEEYGVWSRRLVGDDPDTDDFAMVDFDEEFGRWLVELRDVEHDDDYATDVEAMAAADAVLVEDGYALVGGVPE